MKDINDFISDADKKSSFVRFEDGEPVKGIYKGSKLVDDRFNKGEKTMEYSIEIDGLVKTFNSKSIKLARQLKPVKEGEEIELVKTGEGLSTVWYVGRKD